MGIDTRVWVHREDLKKMDLFNALFLYDKFSGRWQYCITDRFVFEESSNSVSLEEIEEHVKYNSDIPQESRDLLRRLKGLRIIFQMDCEDIEPEKYLELSYYLEIGWENIRKEIKI